MEADTYPGISQMCRVYVALYDSMLKPYDEGKHRECIKLAEKLLGVSNLPPDF